MLPPMTTFLWQPIWNKNALQIAFADVRNTFNTLLHAKFTLAGIPLLALFSHRHNRLSQNLYSTSLQTISTLLSYRFSKCFGCAATVELWTYSQATVRPTPMSIRVKNIHMSCSVTCGVHFAMLLFFPQLCWSGVVFQEVSVEVAGMCETPPEFITHSEMLPLLDF